LSPPHGERPLRALAYLTAAQVCFVLLDATGKRLAGEIGIPLVSLVRHAGHALLMFVFFAPTLGAALWRTKRPGTQLLRGLSLRRLHAVLLHCARPTAAGGRHRDQLHRALRRDAAGGATAR